MERGEFKQTLELATKHTKLPFDNMSYEEMLKTQVPRITVKLIKKMADNAERGLKWANLIGRIDSHSEPDADALRFVMAGVSECMQQEGFQTDEAHVVKGGMRFHQLTVFWADGKDIYEHELHRLGTVDPEVIEQLLIT